MSLIFFKDRETFARTSITSAVPAAEVMLLLLVFGMKQPAAATIGTIIIVVLPLVPPMQCLSTTFFFEILSCFPLSDRAFVIAMVSLKV